MSRKKGPQKRLDLFRRGNTRCPICLTQFRSATVETGSNVTLEHVPPKAVGGFVRCLTCTNCNRNAGQNLDQAASMIYSAAKDRESGRGEKVELDIWGTKHTTYLSPAGGANPKLAAKLASDPSNPLANADPVLLTEVKRGPVFDVSKGITITGIRPPADKVMVSWLRSAYLLMFSFLGQAGYRYAESDSISLIREQIMNPSDRLVPCLLYELPPSFSSHKHLIILKNRQPPFCWFVKVDNMAVLMPQGGTVKHYKEVVEMPDDIRLPDRPIWTPVAFGKNNSLDIDLPEDSPHASVDLFGHEFRGTVGGSERQFIIVNQQGLVVTIKLVN